MIDKEKDTSWPAVDDIFLKFYNYKVLNQPLFNSEDRNLHESFKNKIIF